jgi:hypothetical protein
VRAYEAALAELIRSDPEDSLRFHDLADAPPDEAERGTAEWLAIEYSVIVNLANGRAERPDEEMPAHADEILRLAEGFLQRFRRVDRVAALRAMPYREYLRTPEWQPRRERALERAGRRCQVCYGDEQLDVHHRTYERRGDEAAAAASAEHSSA